MQPSRFTNEQIIGILPEQKAGNHPRLLSDAFAGSRRIRILAAVDEFTRENAWHSPIPRCRPAGRT